MTPSRWPRPQRTVASAAAGRLADRIGAFPLMRGSLWVYGVGLLLGAGLSSLGPLIAGLPVVALAGAVVMLRRVRGSSR
jgi:4-amino-4-deoxy-L-arabinose transferase-like glycosyltransferase